jgi:hypothetical protein
MFTVDNEKAMEDAIAMIRLMSNSSYKNNFHVIFLNKRMHDLFLIESKKELEDIKNDITYELNIHMHIDKERKVVERRHVKRRKKKRGSGDSDECNFY